MATNDGKWWTFQSIRARRATWGQSGYKAIFAPWAFWMCVYTPVFFGALKWNKRIWAKALCIDVPSVAPDSDPPV